jgi:hypothetical protein
MKLYQGLSIQTEKAVAFNAQYCFAKGLLGVEGDCHLCLNAESPSTPNTVLQKVC